MHDTKLDERTCRAARAFLNWTSRQLSIEAKVPVSSIYNFERGRPIDQQSTRRLAETFIEAGVEIIECGGRPIGVREAEMTMSERGRG